MYTEQLNCSMSATKSPKSPKAKKRSEAKKDKGESPPRDFISTLVAKYCPILYLHPTDVNMPSSVEWFLERSRVERWDGSKRRVLKERGEASWQDLLALQKDFNHKWIHLMIEPEDRLGVSLENVDDVPLYVSVKQLEDTEGILHAIEITYMTFYPHNGSYALAPFKFCCGRFTPEVGAHDGDWEHVTVRCHPETGDLQGVWYNRHFNKEGEWVPARAVPIDQATGRIIVYVAKGGHGVYEQPQIKKRVFGIANDAASDEGVIWRPRRCLLCKPADSPEVSMKARARGCELDIRYPGKYLKFNEKAQTYPVAVEVDKSGWVDFRGYWGTIPSPIEQCWFANAEPPVSFGDMKRLWSPCWPEKDTYKLAYISATWKKNQVVPIV